MKNEKGWYITTPHFWYYYYTAFFLKTSAKVSTIEQTITISNPLVCQLPLGKTGAYPGIPYRNVPYTSIRLAVTINNTIIFFILCCFMFYII